jgi:predicted Zn-dependent peptidase
MEEYKEFSLSNGIRVVHRQVTNTKILHCGIILDVGSRDEQPEEYGIAHFWEHMAFKGTSKRKAYHIINSLDSVGGELNAYTTKEKICFYASILDGFAEKAVALLADITFDSVFPDKQIQRERQVILEEMAMYKDNPEDAIQDEFDEQIFANHELSHNILGTTTTVRSFKREHFNKFIARNIDTSKVIISFVGNISERKIKRLANKYLGHLEGLSARQERQPFVNYQSSDITLTRNDIQAHFAMGRPAYAINDDKRVAFAMLVNLLGGPSMNTRLNLALREKLGYVYAVEASYQTYTDTGLFAIFFGTEQKNLKRSIKVVDKELLKLRTQKLGTVQLRSLKEQMMGQLAMSEENNAGQMLMMGKSLLDLNRIQSLDSIFSKLKAVSSSDIMEVANEMLVPETLSSLIYTPENNGVY